MTNGLLDELRERVLADGRPIAPAEARALVDLPAAELPALLALAHEVRRRWWGEGVELESLISAKTGGCPEDCAFCSQSMHFDAPAQRHPFLPLDDVLGAARATEASGATHFCIVVAVRGPDKRLMAQVLRAVEAIRSETALRSTARSASSPATRPRRCATPASSATTTTSRPPQPLPDRSSPPTAGRSASRPAGS